MTRFWLFLYRLSRKQVHARTRRMICMDCGAAIHRNDRFVVLEVRHKDCRDPKGVGQMALPEPLRSMVADA